MSQFTFSFAHESDSDGDAEVEAGVDSATARLTSSPPALAHDDVRVPVQAHTLEQLLSTLPSSLSYTYPLPVPDSSSSNTPSLPRRTLVDIRVQLMAEDDMTVNNTDTASLLASLERSDLERNVYEGGFKAWEGASDLVSYFSDQKIALADGEGAVELGCGPSLPSLLLFYDVLTKGRKSVALTFADYNALVLSHVVLPNLLLIYYHTTTTTITTTTTQLSLPIKGKGEVDLTTTFLDGFKATLARLNVTLSFLSGPWGDELAGLIAGTPNLVLASETLYSPESIPVFTDVVWELLKRRRGDRMVKALVASKRVYFGVGDGVEEFRRVVEIRGGVVKEVMEVRDGVGRVVVEVTLD